MERNGVFKIGTFFIILGFILLIIFITSLKSGGFSFAVLFFGLVTITLGIWMRRRGSFEPEPESRIGLIRKIKKSKRNRTKTEQDKEKLKK